MLGTSEPAGDEGSSMRIPPMVEGAHGVRLRWSAEIWRSNGRSRAPIPRLVDSLKIGTKGVLIALNGCPGPCIIASQLRDEDRVIDER